MEPITSTIPLWIVLISLMAAVGITVCGRIPNLRESIIFLAAGLKLTVLLSLTPNVLAGEIYEFNVINLLRDVGLSFRVDAAGLLFALVSVTLWIPVTIYSIGLLRTNDDRAQTRFYACFAIAISSAVGVAFSANLLTLFIFYEIRCN